MRQAEQKSEGVVDLDLESSKTTPAPLTPGLVTLSMLPRTQWQTLANLDIIKARNKPIKPPEKPEAAPFFMPTVPGVSQDLVFQLDEGQKGKDNAENNARETSLQMNKMQGQGSLFLAKLQVPVDRN